MVVMWCLLGTLFLISVQTSPIPATNKSTPRPFNQDEVIDKIKEMEKRITSDETEIKRLKQRLNTYAQQCSLEANEVCGPCVCKEDRRLRKKYFCDCSLLEPRRDCLEFHQEGHHVDGLYMIKQLKKTFQVYCDQTTDGGGWTVIQRRNGDASVNFYRNWEDYKIGFGDLQHEFWLGNQYLHIMSLTGQCAGANDLRVEIQNYNNDEKHYAKYDHFAVNSEYHKYKLAVGAYTGDVGGDYLRTHDGMKFSTYDQDNDIWDDNCALKNDTGGYWYSNCIGSNPNGRYLLYGDSATDNTKDGLQWGDYLKFVEMKIRRNKDGNCTA